MGRILRLRPEQLDEAQRSVYEAIAGGPRASGPRLFPLTGEDGSLEGPFNAMLLNPSLGLPLQELGGALRYRGALSDRSRELAILVVAAHWDCGFERRAHEAVGAHVGLSEAELAAVRAGADPDLADPEEAAVVRATRLLLERGDLDKGEYDSVDAELGPAKLFEVTALIGYYGLLALQMRVFGVED